MTSVHVEEHEVWMLNQELHLCCESSACSSVNDAMVGRYAEGDGIGWIPSVSSFLAWIFNILRILACLTNRDDCSLGSQHYWRGIRSTDVANARDAERAVGKVFCNQGACVSFISQAEEVPIDL